MVKWRLYVEKWQGEHTTHIGFRATEHDDASIVPAIARLLEDANLVRITVTRLDKD